MNNTMKAGTKIAKMLKKELKEFGGYLTDTRENIEAPMEQLNAHGKQINTYLHAMGIKTRDQVDLLDSILRKLIKP